MVSLVYLLCYCLCGVARVLLVLLLVSGVGCLPLGLRFAGVSGICCLLDFCVYFRCLGFAGLLISGFLIRCLVDCGCCYVYWFLLGFPVVWVDWFG